MWPQAFDEKLRSKFPHVTRLVQTVLWHPKAVRVLRSQLQPPAHAHEYTAGAANLWGPGPNPFQALEWSYDIPWSGAAPPQPATFLSIPPQEVPE